MGGGEMKGDTIIGGDGRVLVGKKKGMVVYGVHCTFI